MKAHFVLMADYNQTMNQKIYLAASRLSDGELIKDRGAFFDSIIGTLNHILVGDIIWLKRFANHFTDFPQLDCVRVLDMPTSLRQILCSDLASLENSREGIDQTIKLFVGALSDDNLAETLLYKNTKGMEFNKCFMFVLQHFFNHQTHHRGQVTTLLYQQGIDVGVTDLLANIPETKQH